MLHVTFLAILKVQRLLRRVPAKCTVYFRDEVENRFAPKIHDGENRPHDLTLDYLRERHYRAIRTAVRLADDALAAQPTRHRTRNSSVGGRDEMAGLPPKSSFSPRPHPYPLLLRHRDSRPLSLATAALSTSQRQFAIHLRTRATSRLISPQKVSPKEGGEFFQRRILNSPRASRNRDVA